MKINPLLELPIPMRIVMCLVSYIEKAGGSSEMQQALTIMREVDPMAADACQVIVNQLRSLGG